MREHNPEHLFQEKISREELVSFSAGFLAPEVMRDVKNTENVLCQSNSVSS